MYSDRKFESQILSLFPASKISKFDPSQLPDLTGIVVIVTGGYSGLSDLFLLYIRNWLIFRRGLATTPELTRHGAKVYIASRSRTKVGAAIQSLKEKQPRADLYFLCVDLSDLESVKKGVEEFLSFDSQSRARILS